MSVTQPIKNEKKLLDFRNYYKEIVPRPRNYALIVMGLNTALRIGDLLSLRWEDVRNEHGYRKHIYITERKTGKQNVLAMNRTLMEALDFYYRTLSDPQPSDAIFSSQKTKGEPITRSQAFRIIKRAACHCGLNEHISCHSLRKTFGYYAWKNGTPPALLMSIYNHSSYEITKHYLCIDQMEKDEVYMKTSL